MTIPRNIKRDSRFPIAFFSSDPELFEIELRVNGARRSFRIEVGGEERDLRSLHQVDVHGALDAMIFEWGPAAIDDIVALEATPNKATARGTVTL